MNNEEIKKEEKFPITPLFDKVIIKAEKDAARGGKLIILPTGDNTGRVVAVGEGRFVNGQLVSLKVKTGDLVLVSTNGLMPVSFRHEVYFVCSETAILGVVDEQQVV